MDQLSDHEQAMLQCCESLIAQHPRDSVVTGKSLQRIRDLRLYRDAHVDFEAYCIDGTRRPPRWAKQTIAAAAVVKELGLEFGAPRPTRRQSLALLKLPQHLRLQAWNDNLVSQPASPKAPESGSRPTRDRKLRRAQSQLKRLRKLLSQLGLDDEVGPALSAIANKLSARFRRRDPRVRRRRALIDRPRSIPKRLCECTVCGAKSRHRVGELARAGGVRCRYCGGNVVEERFA